MRSDHRRIIGQLFKDRRSMEVDEMKTKSRYEVIADLEKQKRDLIIERDSFPDKIKHKEKEIKMHKRELEDLEEELEEYKKTVKERQDTIKELIESVDESLKRFNTKKEDS